MGWRSVTAAAAAVVVHVALANISLEPWMFLSSKTPYWPSQLGAREVMPGHCKLVHINHLGRHGSRHATKLKDAERLLWALTQLSPDELTPKGQQALAWLREYLEVESKHLGELTDAGVLEHRGVATRMWGAYEGELVDAVGQRRPFVFEASPRARTIASRDGFLQGFESAGNAVLARLGAAPLPTPEHTADPSGRTGLLLVEPPPCPGGAESADAVDGRGAPRASTLEGAVGAGRGTSPAPGDYGAGLGYAKLRFFDVCNAYTEYTRAKPWMAVVAPHVANASAPTSHETSFWRQLLGKRGVELLARMTAGEMKKLLRAEAALQAADKDDTPPEEMERLERKVRSLRAGGGGGGGAEDPLELVEPGAPRQKKYDRRKRGEEGGGRGGVVKDPSGAIPALAQLVADAYSVCQIEANAMGRTDHWCSLFASSPAMMDTMAKAELLRDLGDYYKQGAGEPVASAPACLLLEDFIATGEVGAGLAPHHGGGTPSSAPGSSAARAAARVGGAPAAHFRFGHSETVMPLLSVLGLYQDPSAPGLQDYYHAELARGTATLLNATRSRLKLLQEEYDLPELDEVLAPPTASGGSGGEGGAIGPAESASGAALPPLPRGAAREKEGGGGACKPGGKCKGRKGGGGGGRSALSFTTQPQPGTDRALPAGFNEPLLMALKHPWSGARLAPMAANVQWLMYDCGDAHEDGTGAVGGAVNASASEVGVAGDSSSGEGEGRVDAAPSSTPSTDPASRMYGLWVKMLHNEREIGFPACGVSEPGVDEGEAFVELKKPVNRAARPFGLSFPCPWETVKTYYRSTVYARFGISTCSPAEWEEWCGGMGTCAQRGNS